MPQFDPYQMIARRLSKDSFARRDLLTVSTFMVEDIERLIGPRLSDKVYEFTGIYFASSHPQMEYRKKGFRHLTKIRLAAGSSKDPGNALWQLAHECVHLITPFGGSTVLEEGIACWYQERWVDKIPQVFPEWVKTRRKAGYFPSYDEAYSLVDALMTTDPEVMKRLRKSEPVISKISAELLKQEAPWLNKAVARKLAARFKRGRPRRVTNQSASISTPVANAVAPSKMTLEESSEARTESGQELSQEISFDPRTSEISRQAARLHIGMELIPARLERFDIPVDDVYAAFKETYGGKILRL